MRKSAEVILSCILTGVLTVGTFTAAEVTSRAAGETPSWEKIETSSATEESTAEGDEEAKSALLLPSAGAGYALSAKKVSLSDVKQDYEAKTAAAESTAEASSVESAEEGSSEASSEASGSESDEEASVTESSTDSASAESSAEESTQETTEAAAENSAAESTQAADAASTAPAAVDVPASDPEILSTSLTPVQLREYGLVRQAGDSGTVDESMATQAAAQAVTVVVGGNTDALNTAGTPLVSSAEAASTESSTDSSAEESTEAVTEESTEETTQAEEASSEESSESDSSLAVACVNDYVNVRSDPSMDGEVVGKLYANSVATILEPANDDGWVKITSGSVTGYVRQEYIATGDYAQSLADSVGTKQAVVTTETLRVRAAASADSDVISLIGEGQTLDIISEEDGWYKVNTEDGEGYISADFADVETIYPEAVSKEEEEAEIAAEEAKKKAEEDAAAAAEEAKAASMGQQVVDYAMQFLGNPYVWGGSSLTNGTDCSGFTMAVYAHFGVSLPHYDVSQRSCGTAVSSLANARPGDLICYYGHVGIYIGNNQIINASNPRNGIKISPANYRSIAAIRRIFN
jgi:cell wall-associated NlpC family hydrolase